MQKYTYSRKADEDEDESPMTERYLPFNNRLFNLRTVSFTIDEAVKEPSYYRLIVEELQELSEHDTVQVRFNSTGGRADGMVSLLEAFRMTDATVVGVIAGECHSAASILALHCDEIIVTPYSTMMCHNISYGTAGKDSDIINMVTHTSNWSKLLMQETYSGFLSPKELDELINGKELWFNAVEIGERLEKKKAFEVKAEKAAVRPKRKPKETVVDTSIQE
jgi:ATP-dependent protease ClpP protease subunit